MTTTRYYELRGELTAALNVPDDTTDKEIMNVVQSLVHEEVPVIKPALVRTRIRISDTEAIVVEPNYRTKSPADSGPMYIRDGTSLLIVIDGDMSTCTRLYANLSDEIRAQLIVALGGIVPTT